MARTKHFTVEGSGEFPVDMLRYDNCWPVGSEDAISIHLRYGAIGEDQLFGKMRRVRLATTYPSAPTDGRWRSFTWRVVPDHQL